MMRLCHLLTHYHYLINTHKNSDITTIFPILKNLKIPEKPKTKLIKSHKIRAWWNRELSQGRSLLKSACLNASVLSGASCRQHTWAVLMGFLRLLSRCQDILFFLPRTISPYPSLSRPFRCRPGNSYITSARVLTIPSTFRL